MSIRSDKVRLTLRKAISEIINYEHNFKVLVSVSDIDLSPDLSNAKIYISVLGNNSSKLSVIDELNNNISNIKSLLCFPMIVQPGDPDNPELLDAEAVTSGEQVPHIFAQIQLRTVEL